MTTKLTPDPEDLFARKLPEVRAWVLATIAEHAAVARPVDELGFRRLPLYFQKSLLSHAKVVLVPVVPMPPLTAFGLAGLSEFDAIHGAAITYNDTYFVDQRFRDDESLHFHELVHVIQWSELGVDRFLMSYADGILKHGYRDSPLEAMAYRHQAGFDQGIAPYDVAAAVKAELSTDMARQR